MNKFKLAVLTVALGLAAGSFARAQAPDDNGPPHRHGHRDLAEMLDHTLQLTDAQKAQVKPLVEAAQPKLEAIHEQARAQADEVLKQLHTQIRPLLDATQQKRLDALQTLRDTAPHDGPQD